MRIRGISARARDSTSTRRSRRGRRTTACTATWRANCRSWWRRIFRTTPRHRYFRPLDGRSWRADHRAQEFRAIQNAVGIRADQRPCNAHGARRRLRIIWARIRTGGESTMRANYVAQAVPFPSSSISAGGPVSQGSAAPAGEVVRLGRAVGAEAHAAHAARLRSWLLLHSDLHGRPPAAPRGHPSPRLTSIARCCNVRPLDEFPYGDSMGTRVANPGCPRNCERGHLIGRPFRDAKGPYAIVTDAVLANSARRGPVTVETSLDDERGLLDTLLTKHPTTEKLGWFHSHPFPMPSYSNTDAENQRFWSEPYHLGLLANLEERECGKHPCLPWPDSERSSLHTTRGTNPSTVRSFLLRLSPAVSARCRPARRPTPGSPSRRPRRWSRLVMVAIVIGIVSPDRLPDRHLDDRPGNGGGPNACYQRRGKRHARAESFFEQREEMSRPDNSPKDYSANNPVPLTKRRRRKYRLHQRQASPSATRHNHIRSRLKARRLSPPRSGDLHRTRRGTCRGDDHRSSRDRYAGKIWQSASTWLARPRRPTSGSEKKMPG